MDIRGFPFGTVSDRQPVASSATDVPTYALAYQMMRDAKALPTQKYPCVAGGVLPIAANSQRKTPIFVRIRAVLINSISKPYVYLGTDLTQTQANTVLDRIGDGGQIEFLLYPGQELWASYVGDVNSQGDIYVSVATFDEAVIQAKRATGQAT
jgi:hypothetical protein